MKRFAIRAALRNTAAVASLLLLGALTACMVPPAREPVTSFADLGNGETLVVGRLELVPPLAEGEQKIKGWVVGGVDKKVFVIVDERHRVLTQEPTVEDYDGRIEAILGQNFFVRSKSEPFYIVAGMMYLDIGGSELNQMYFPGGLKASLEPDDKAVYIGTIQYHRNEFFEITKVKVVDDYRRANAEFKQKFGTRRSLRKALLTRVK